MVGSLVEYHGELVAAGGFTLPGHLNNIARLRDGRWQPLGTGVDGGVADMIVHDDDLYVVGLFENAGGKSSLHVARWSETITPVTLEEFTASLELSGVRLEWVLSAEAPSELYGVAVQRAEAEAGPYEDLTPSALLPEIRMSYVDAGVEPGQRYWYRLCGRGLDGTAQVFRAIAVEIPASRARWARLQAVSEPAGGGPVEIRFVVGGAAVPVHLEVFDPRGRLVRTLARQNRDAGEHLVAWDRLSDAGAPVARGVYFVRLRVPRFGAETRRLVVLHR
jgi:hypothetical protein